MSGDRLLTRHLSQGLQEQSRALRSQEYRHPPSDNYIFMNDARFWISLTDVKGMTAIGLQMYLYAVSNAEFDCVKANWTELLVRCFLARRRLDYLSPSLRNSCARRSICRPSSACPAWTNVCPSR